MPTSSTNNRALPSAVPWAPGRVPLLGHAVGMMRDPLGSFRRMREYGPVVAVKLGPITAVVVNDPDVIREVLVAEPRKYDKGSLFEKAERFLGNGLATSVGEFHLRQRRHMQPAFGKSRLIEYADIMIDVAKNKVDSWHQGQHLDVMQEMHDVTLTTVARTLFSTDIGDTAVLEIRRFFPSFLKGITRRSLSPFPFLEKLPTIGNRRFDTGVARMRSAVLSAVEAYRHDATDHGDLLSLLVAPDQETGDRMSDEQIHDEILTLIMAGTETSASMLSWAFHHLSQHPEAEHRFHAELDEVLAGKPITLPAAHQLKYLHRVLNETLRLHGLPLIARRALTEVVVGGHKYPAGTQFFISLYALQKDARYFSDPDRFDPDRWLTDPSDTPNSARFLPFGAGVHKCIGNSYAMNDMTIIAATVGSRWRLVAKPDHQVREKMAGVARPDRVPVTAQLRTSANAAGQDRMAS